MCEKNPFYTVYTVGAHHKESFHGLTGILLHYFRCFQYNLNARCDLLKLNSYVTRRLWAFSVENYSMC